MTQDMGGIGNDYDNLKDKAQYQNEAVSSAQAPTLHMTGSQNNPSVRVTSK
jgi:hypothetical protein